MDPKIRLNEVVERLLNNERRCRTDTKWLTYKVFSIIAKHYNQQIYIPYNLWSKFPSFESVARCKRDFMNKEGKFNEEFIKEEGVTYEPSKKN